MRPCSTIIPHAFYHNTFMRLCRDHAVLCCAMLCYCPCPRRLKQRQTNARLCTNSCQSEQLMVDAQLHAARSPHLHVSASKPTPSTMKTREFAGLPTTTTH